MIVIQSVVGNKNIKPIQNFDGYFVSINGDVYSNKRGSMRLLKPYATSSCKYLQVHLKNNSNVLKNCFVHRLVAITFIPNPQNLPEVDHKDKNIKNNSKWSYTKYYFFIISFIFRY